MFIRLTTSVRALCCLLGMGAVLCAFTSQLASAQSYTFASLYSFFDADGTTPFTGLIQASDGNFYGTTGSGGSTGNGTVFKITPTGAEAVLHSFAGGTGDGASPDGSLIQASDGNFYGTTLYGGANNVGTVFRINAAGVETVLHSFAGGTADGASPEAGLIQASDGNLYGTSYGGGSSNNGVVFKITLAGSESLLYSFAGGSDGAGPSAPLVQASDGKLYGTTYSGGAGSNGTVFRITLTGTESLLHSFTGGSGDGGEPGAALVQASDGNLYGITNFGGASDNGTIFKVTLAGSFSLLHSFTGGNGDGAVPYAPLVQASDGKLYGTTVNGGASNDGVIFKISLAGSESLLHSFAGGSGDGARPEAALLQASDGKLYGMTVNGGASDKGVVFSITLTGAESLLHSFPVTGENFPDAGLIEASDGNIYGTTDDGGAYGYGAIFRVSPAGTVTDVYDFTGGVTDGGNPYGTLVQGTDGNFYGTATASVTSFGTIFKYTPGGAVTILHVFDDGNPPNGTLVQGADGNFYGTTRNGGIGAGSVFAITTTGLYGVIYSFRGGPGDGSNPFSGLVQGSDGNLYGTTTEGGSYGFGTVFKVTPGGVETLLHSFSGGTDGAYPRAPLVQGTDGNFYGTTYNDGAYNSGTVFAITPGGLYGVLYSFQGYPIDGSFPYTGLILGTDGNFYGTTESGGANSKGTVFKITPAGVETMLHSFTGADGSDPVGSLLLASNGNFYGTTYGGGANGDGTIFVLTPESATLTSLSPASTPACGPAFTLTVQGSNFVSGAVVAWNGTALPTTFVSASQLTAAVPASDIAAPGAASITIQQNGIASNALPFTITNPVPVLASISPASTDAGGPSFTLIAKGKCFINGSTIDWKGSPLTTTFISATQLKATVPSSLIASSGKATITVVTPSPGGGASVSKTFTILQTTLKLTAASLVKNSDGSYTATVSLKNVGFLSATSIQITKSTLGAAATKTTLPVSAGTIAAGATVTAKLSYPSSAGTSGTVVKLAVAGTFTGGKFAGSLKLTLP